MKLHLRLAFAILCLGNSFSADSQKNYSFEFEAAPLFTNRAFRGPYPSYVSIETLKSKSRFTSGFYLQFGINFRESKGTRFFAGIQLLRQNMSIGKITGYLFFPSDLHVTAEGDLVGYMVPGSDYSQTTSLTLPLLMKQTWLTKQNFRLISETGIAPVFLLAANPDEHNLLKQRIYLSTEFALSLEWTSKKGNTLGVKFPALSYNIVPITLIRTLRQHNYNLSMGIKFGFGQSKTSQEEIPKKQNTNISFETEITSIFSNAILSMSKSLPSDHPDYDFYFNQFQEFQKAPSQFLPGAYLQFGFNFRETKRTRFFCGLRFTSQDITTTFVHPRYYSTFDTTLGYETFHMDYTEYLLKPLHMTYIAVPLFIKQSIVSKPNFRFGYEIGATPGIQIYEDNEPWTTKENYYKRSIQTELSLSFEKKLKNGNWIGVKLPSFNYSLLTNVTRNLIDQRHYSIGMGVRYIFQE
jgi:hypothetical protein